MLHFFSINSLLQFVVYSQALMFQTDLRGLPAMVKTMDIISHTNSTSVINNVKLFLSSLHHYTSAYFFIT